MAESFEVTGYCPIDSPVLCGATGVQLNHWVGDVLTDENWNSIGYTPYSLYVYYNLEHPSWGISIWTKNMGLASTWKIPYGTLPSNAKLIPPPPTTWIIQTQKNLRGTIEPVTGVGLLWHLTSPVVKDVWYGLIGDIPATWIDLSDGTEQMAVIRGTDVFLDKGLTGGIGEVNLKLTDINIISQKTGYTTQISYSPPPPTMKWKCSGAPDYICTQAADGTYNSQTECQAACIAPPPPRMKWKCSGAPDYICTQAADGTYNSQAECQAVCMPTPTTGSLDISSSPPGAEIFLDGADHGKAPAVISGIPVGSHDYKLVLSGYKDAAGTVTIEAGKTTAINVILEKIPAAGISTGTLLGLSIIATGIVAAVIFATKEKKEGD